jgi:MYXO-CTERM domain-containing protein
MAGGTMRTRLMSAPRMFIGAAVVGVGILGVAPAAFAGRHAGPLIVPHVATFDIPSAPTSRVVWTLNVWKQGDLIGSDTGTSGVLTVPLPRTTNGKLQADVRRDGRWYSGYRVNLPGSGGGGSGTGGGNGHGGKGHGGHGSGGHGTGGNGGGGSTGTGGGTGGGGTTGTTGGGPGGGGTSPAGGGSTGAGSGSAGTGANGVGSTPAGSGVHGAAVDPITLAVGAKTPATALAFTGSGSAFWTTAFGGFGLFVLGAYLAGRRRSDDDRPSSLPFDF